jgi:hypothetical protein
MVTVYDLIGLTGISLSSFCYARVQWHRDYAKQLSYSLLNLIGSILLAISIMENWNLAAFVSNAIWGAISAYGVYRCLNYRRRGKAAAD